MPRLRAFRQILEYLAVRCGALVLALLPLSVASWLGRRLGDLWRLLDGRHRRRAEDQAREVLELDAAAARDFAKRNFRNYGLSIAEFAQQTRMRAGDFDKLVDFGDAPQLMAKLLAEGKGLLFITAHYGNWEWCNSTATTLGLTGGSIARPLDNPRLNEFVRWVRERNGLRIFDKAGAIRKALGTLREKKVVGILIDQDAGRKGLMSPFLGKPASTLTIPVELSLRTGSPLLAVVLKRGNDRGKRFTLLHAAPHYPNVDADPETETRRLIDALNADLSDIILQAPDQWFWIHRRWKSVGRK